ncbi:MAG: amidohydrolase family protein [Anaerolineaceae bacterium]|nr:amidohydrolase family protein [Anaerolineaceae bacterium]
MKIIDTHCHLGVSNLSGLTITEHDLLRSMEENGVMTSLVMPHAVTDNAIDEHDKVARLCQKYPGRFFGIVNLSPHWKETEYWNEVSRCINELNFVAIKLNPMQHLVSPMWQKANKVFDTASQLKVPVIIHTGPGVPWSLPSLTIPQALRKPDLPIILAHAGYGIYTAEAQVAAQVCNNIFLEPSWCTVDGLEGLIHSVGADRIMLGSDQPMNLPVELVKYKSANLSDQELNQCFYKTAQKIFNIF